MEESQVRAVCPEHRNYQMKSIVYGAAVGDALGVPYEFMSRDSFECVGMAEGGVHGVPKGTFSDDTSMLLATVDSLRELKSIDADDMRARFCKWLYQGAYTADGNVFDVGNATANALERGYGGNGVRDNGNGSLMRIAPLALTAATDDEIRAVSAITHAHPWSMEACVAFVNILRDVLGGAWLAEAIQQNCPEDEKFSFMRDLADLPRDEVRSSGFVLDTLGAALWCALHTESYQACVLAAVNLGSDSDTTACVAGALAGALYGYEAIPEEWLQELRGKDVIASCLGES